MHAADPWLALVRAIHFAAVIALLGQLAYFFFVARGRERPPHFLPLAAWCTGIAAASALVWLGLEARGMSGLPLEEALAPDTLRTVATQTLFGRIWCVRMGLLVAIVAALVLLRDGDRGPAALVAFALAAAAVAALAGMGHAAGGRGLDKVVRLAADALHLLAAGVWLGALLPLALCLRQSSRRADPAAFAVAADATRRFSVLGMACVGAIVLTGIVNTTYTVHGLAAFYETRYGVLLAAKISLFFLIAVIAAINRYVLAPRLAAQSREDVAVALRALQRNAVAELVAGIAILAIVGLLGISMPPSAPMSHPV